MSSQFSYELDERQIRILLQDGELAYDATAWDRFEQSVPTNVKNHSGPFAPKINFNISRSVIVPIIFIFLIGGLSAMLFSFVDFKKKEVVKEIPAANAPKITLKKNTPAAKIQPVVVKVNPLQVAAKPLEDKLPAVTTPTLNKTDAIKTTAIVTVKEKPVIEVTQKENTIVATNRVKKEVAPVIRRNRKKAISEEIPTINTSATNLNSATVEPELELK